MKQTAADIGIWTAIAGALTGLPQVLEAVPAEWGPAGPVLAGCCYLAVTLTRRIAEPLQELVRQGASRDEAIARIERDMRHVLWTRTDADPERPAAEG